MNNFIAFFRWLFDKPLTIRTEITPRFAIGGRCKNIHSTPELVNTDTEVAILVSSEDVMKSRIEEVAGLNFDEIVSIFKDNKNTYTIGDKPLAVTLYDLSYREYCAIPF